MQIPVIYKNYIPTHRDFLFEPECYENFGNENGVFAHVVDAHLSFVQIYNVSPISIYLPKKHVSVYSWNTNKTEHTISFPSMFFWQQERQIVEIENN